METVGFHSIMPVTAALPMDIIAMDFIVGFPETEGFTVILILVDVATQFTILRSLKSKSTEDVAFALFEVFADFGIPREIQSSDQDPSFFNEVMEKFRKATYVKVRKVMKYFPVRLTFVLSNKS